MANGDIPPYLAEQTRRILESLPPPGEQKTGEGLGSKITGIFKAIAPVLQGAALGWQAADPTYRNAPFAGQQLMDIQQRRRDTQAYKQLNEALHKTGRLPEGVDIPVGMDIAAFAKLMGPSAGKMTRLGKPGDWVFNPATGQMEQLGGASATAKPMTNEIAIRQAYKSELAAAQREGRSPDPSIVNAYTSMLEANQGKLERGIAGATGKFEALKGVKTVGDTGKNYVWSTGPNVGQRIARDTPLGVADQYGTVVTPAQEKIRDASEQTMFLLGQIGIAPGGVVTPQAADLVGKLYSRTSTLGGVARAGAVRKWGELTGDPDAKKMEQLVKLLTTVFGKASAGTLRVNQTELGLIMSAHPEPTDSAISALDKLRRLSLYIQAIDDRIIRNAPAPPTGAEPFPNLRPEDKPGAPASIRVPGQTSPQGGYLSPEDAQFWMNQ